MLEWNGDRVYDEIVTASKAATPETVDEAVLVAREFTPVLTGDAQRSLSRENDGLDVTWGFHVVDEQGQDRGIWIEIGAHGRPGVRPLRRAADIVYPTLAGRIRRRRGG